jgi:ABC-2 type transport system permease protein
VSEIQQSPVPAGPSSGFARRSLPNIIAVARRELMYRLRSRAYRFTTLFLVLAGVGLALAPTIIAWFDRGSTGDRIEVVAGDALPGVDVAAAFQQLLNAAAGGTPSIPVGGEDEAPKFTVVAAPDLETARAHVVDGAAAGAIAISRDAAGDLRFDAYTNASAVSGSVALVYQAATSIAIQDRLTRAGVPPVNQATLFNPPAFEVQSPDPNDTDKPFNPADNPGAFLVGFGLSIAIFMAILLYGQWIAYSVAEEKSSRVMEIVLAAATPFQLLAGKVIGVGALALLQYVIVSIPMIAALVFQSQISALVLGTPAGGGLGGVDLGASLSIGMVVAFGVMLVLGFAVYASLYAGAASLVTRQEDINQIIAPLTIVSVIGYLVSTYAGTGLIPLDSPLVVVLSYIPLFSPYLMLTRLATGTAAPLEVVVAIALLVLTIPVALWIAARLYRSGVLMYGQAPSPRTLWRALRAG